LGAEREERGMGLERVFADQTVGAHKKDLHCLPKGYSIEKQEVRTMPCEVVKNQAMNKEFYYCRTHKEECKPDGCSDSKTVTASEELIKLSDQILFKRPGYSNFFPMKNCPDFSYYNQNPSQETWDEIHQECAAGLDEDLT